MKLSKAVLVLTLSLFLLSACNLQQPAAPPFEDHSEENLPASTLPAIDEAPTATEEVPISVERDPEEKVFRVVVIVDTSSEVISKIEAEALIHDADKLLLSLTDFSVEMIDFVQMEAPINELEDGPYRDLDVLVDEYTLNNPADLPDGFMIMSYGHTGDAKLYGGYAYTSPAPADHQYRFITSHASYPVFHIGVVHYSERYAECGYNGEDEPVQTTSLGGECTNQDGVACVMHNGYQMCEDSTEGLYASTRTYFSADTVVHEIMHNFGHEEDYAYDHYGTASCTEWMAESTSTRQYDADDNLMMQQNTGICPLVFDRFLAAFEPSFTSTTNEEINSQSLPFEGVWTGSFFDMNSSSLTDASLELKAYSENEYVGVLEVLNSDGNIYVDEIVATPTENGISFQDSFGKYYLLEHVNGELSGGRSPDCFECESEGIITLRMDNASAEIGSGGLSVPTGLWTGTYTNTEDGLEEGLMIEFFPLEDEPNSYLGSFTHFLAEGGTTYLSLGGHLDGNMLTFRDDNNLYYQATIEGDTISGNVSAECFGCLPEEAIFTLSKE